MANGLMGLFGMLPQEAEAMPRGLFAPDPDLEWLVDQVRKARLAEELRAAGFNPDVTPGQALREFAVTAPVELAMAAFPAARFFPKTTGAAAGLLSYFGLTGEAGSSDEGVKETQRRLKELGYYTGPIDGKMGPQTQAAMQRYEQDRVQREQAEAERLKAQAEAERIQFRARAGAASGRTARGRRTAHARDRGERIAIPACLARLRASYRLHPRHHRRLHDSPWHGAFGQSGQPGRRGTRQ